MTGSATPLSPSASLWLSFMFIRLPALGLKDGTFAGWPFAGWTWPRFWTSFALPFAALAIVLIFKSLSRRDPFRANYGKFRRTS